VSEISVAKAMFEILFLAFAIMALLRLPREVRRMRERKKHITVRAAVPDIRTCGRSRATPAKAHS
jgi:hypothetical protein